jgi:hypothetical protein
MHLDVLTLVAMGSFAAACAGVMLLGAWWQNRKTPALALWGIADIIIAFGILSLMLGLALPHVAWPLLGSTLLALAPGLIWKAARSLDCKPASLPVTFFGAMLLALAIAVPAMRHVTGSLSLAMGTIYLFAAAETLWIGRKEGLIARRPLMVLTAMQAAVLLIGTYSTFAAPSARGKCHRL